MYGNKRYNVGALAHSKKQLLPGMNTLYLFSYVCPYNFVAAGMIYVCCLLHGNERDTGPCNDF